MYSIIQLMDSLEADCHWANVICVPWVGPSCAGPAIDSVVRDAYSVDMGFVYSHFCYFYFFVFIPTVTGHRLDERSYLPRRWCVDRPGNKDIKHLWLAINISYVFSSAYRDGKETHPSHSPVRTSQDESRKRQRVSQTFPEHVRPRHRLSHSVQ